MTNTSEILATVKELQALYAGLMQNAHKLALSPIPAERAMAYEISIFVATQTAATKKILEKIPLSEPVCEENGYGALAE